MIVPASETGVLIRPLQRRHEAEACARMMAASEPWITLQYDYKTALRILSSHGKEIYLAFSGGEEIIGFILLSLKGIFVGYIQSICVGPQWRGQGVGHKLVEFAEERVFDQHPNMFVCVSSFNHDARRFYHRLGYEAVGELKNYIVEGQSEILLRKSIGSLAEFRRKAAPA